MLAGLGAPPVDALTAVFERWAELAGPALARPRRTRRRSRTACSLVAVADGYGANEWRYRQGDVLRRCDEALGEGVVTRVEARITAPAMSFTVTPRW